MQLLPGAFLGPYEIAAAIGAGGMGEVYRARDSKLGRDVALKVLSSAVADDAERLGRFRREAQILASLNHPNIAHIHGLEDSGPMHALVLEMVEGPTLADRIAQGPLPLAQALAIARQIAEALEYAHERGIIHRDLKPANIKVRDDGTVKVLDFGLAKALDPSAASSVAAMNSPTLTDRATEAGVILGTAAYMAPEQALGKPVDRRADIWAFGVVLYEMLTGRRAFEGEGMAVLANVLREDVDWRALPPDVPVAVRRLLKRCLQKDPRRRLSAIGDARLELDEEAGDGDLAAVPHPATRAGRLTQALPWALAAVLGVALIALLAAWATWREKPAGVARRMLVDIGADANLATLLTPSVALSPDGNTLAFVARIGAAPQLFLRRLDELQSRKLDGTEGAQGPFFSPDGRWLAFFSGRKLKKVAAAGGAVIELCDAPSGRGGTWIDADTIVFGPAQTPDAPLMKVAAAGGTASALPIEPKGSLLRWPRALPGGHLLFTRAPSGGGGDFDNADLVVAPSKGEPKVVVRGAYFGQYLPTGHLLFIRKGVLFAVPFDLDRLETAGTEMPVLEGIAGNQLIGAAQMTVSHEGTLVYVPGSSRFQVERSFHWLARDGKMTVINGPKGDFNNVQLSPDGKRIALDVLDGRQRDIWVFDIARAAMTQLTFDPANDQMPAWTPDGTRIVFASDRAKANEQNLYWVNADGSGETSRLTEVAARDYLGSWHPSEKTYVFFRQDITNSAEADLMLLSLEQTPRGLVPRAVTPLFQAPGLDVLPKFSPDGRWIAYSSDESGRPEVYVRPFPGPGGKWRISVNGGSYPRWSRAAQELLFFDNGRLFSARYSARDQSFVADPPQPWSATDALRIPSGTRYDIAPDGRVVLLVDLVQATAPQKQVVVLSNFFDLVRKMAPANK